MSEIAVKTEKPTRPVMRYHGGKYNLAKWIISHFPKHHIYTEAFCGAASVLMQKERCYSECINDLCGEVVNVFRVLRDKTSAEALREQLYLTPFAHAEFELAYQPSGEAVEQARRTIVKSFMGFGSSAIGARSAASAGFRPGSNFYRKPSTGFRANASRSGTIPAHDWSRYPDVIPAFVERLRGVVIENKDASAIIKQHDTERTLHYVDPPYPKVTRGDKGDDYTFEMSDEQHRELAATLQAVKGMVILSGYASALYDEELFPDWHRVERPTMADGARPRIEVLWLNASAHHALKRLRAPLFNEDLSA